MLAGTRSHDGLRWSQGDAGGGVDPGPGQSALERAGTGPSAQGHRDRRRAADVSGPGRRTDRPSVPADVGPTVDRRHVLDVLHRTPDGSAAAITASTASDIATVSPSAASEVTGRVGDPARHDVAEHGRGRWSR